MASRKHLKHSSNRGRRASIPWDVSITELAGRIGYHPSHVGRVLQGKAKPGLEVARRIAGQLGMSMEGMLRKIEERKKKENGESSSS